MVTTLPLRVNDLKQYAYCPRIVFYQYIMPVAKKATFKMEHGRQAETEFSKLEKRRGFKKYHLENAERTFNTWLSSKKYGLSGRIDLLLRTEEELYPVDFKYTLRQAQKNHFVQLAGYAVIVEDRYSLPARTGFIYLLPQEKAVEVELNEQLREELFDMVDCIRQMIQSESMPEPTDVSERCVECEYRNYCGDVF